MIHNYVSHAHAMLYWRWFMQPDDAEFAAEGVG
jgi:hypothetical protein